jgi:murein DD-endopeptidase MepM/ murein hydrolase activator NlpD
MRRVRGLVVAAALAVLAAAPAPGAMADNPTPCASPSPAVASSARTCTPTQSPLDQLKQRLGGDLAAALTTQQTLSQSVTEASASEQMLSAELTIEESRVADLQNQVAQLDRQIADLEARIATEKEQIATLARALYRKPGSFLDIIASSGSLSQALAETTDMIIAGTRAHALQDKLQSDLTQVQADREARQSDLDQETAALQEVQSGIDQITAVQSQLNGLTAQLSAVIDRIRTAAAQLPNVPPDVSTALATLLEGQEQALAQESESAAWAAANAGGGLAAVMTQLPGVTSPAGITFSWPLAGTITQPFGPTTFALEPPLGPYPHFHTGIDIAAPLGSPVYSAADGMVVAVAHTDVGYGNYVIVAHGAGVMTLYGHLLATNVAVGQHVSRGQLVGLEGMSGFATGPHLHFEVRVGGLVTDPIRFLPPH